MPARAALVDALRQVAHLGHPVGDLLAEQHPAAARLRPLPDHDLDRVGAAQVVGVHPVPRGQQLVDEAIGVLALLGQHAAVTRGRAGPDRARPSPQRLLRRGRERPEAHPRDRDRDLQADRLLREPGPQRDVGGTALAVALERVPRDARTEEEQVVEVRHAALGAEAADVVDPLARHPVDLVDRVAVEEGRLAQARAPATRKAGREPLPLGESVELGHQ
jgi:hypothetical protein